MLRTMGKGERYTMGEGAYVRARARTCARAGMRCDIAMRCGMHTMHGFILCVSTMLMIICTSHGDIMRAWAYIYMVCTIPHALRYTMHGK